MSLEARVTDLESRLAFQDDTIQALNDVLVAQQKVLERLQLQMSALLKRQEEMVGQFESFEEEAPPRTIKGSSAFLRHKKTAPWRGFLLALISGAAVRRSRLRLAGLYRGS